MLRETLDRLAHAKGNPCVTISLNTHRTHPDCAKDAIVLKNLCKEAEDRLVSEFGKRPVAGLLDRLAALPERINERENLESLHIFLSEDTEEVVKSTWPVTADGVHISDSFAIRPLIAAYNRSESYLILLLSQSGVQMFEALNDAVVDELRNDDFPFSENPHYMTSSARLSDGKAVDNMVREFLNKVDKAVVRAHQETGLDCVVICTEDNHSRLMQVADRPDVYVGQAPINYNDTAAHSIAAQAWEIIRQHQEQRKKAAVGEMQGAVGQGRVVTDLREIYRAVKEGRGELLLVSKDFTQPALVNGQDTIEPVDDATVPGVVEDIVGSIAWEVVLKKGRAVFTENGTLGELGNIALKVRY